MLTVGISVSSRIKLLERSLVIRVKNIGRVVQAVAYKMVPAAELAGTSLAAADACMPLGVARTVMPNTDRDFNDTFQHIRCGLDSFYKERNPIFNNTIATDRSEAENAATYAQGVCFGIDSTLKGARAEACVVLEDAKTPALWVSRTVVPAERLNYSDTFLSVRAELDGFYKERNPIFNNTAASATVTIGGQAADEPQQADRQQVEKYDEVNEQLQAVEEMPAPVVAAIMGADDSSMKESCPDVSLSKVATYQEILNELDMWTKKLSTRLEEETYTEQRQSNSVESTEAEQQQLQEENFCQHMDTTLAVALIDRSPNLAGNGQPSLPSLQANLSGNCCKERKPAFRDNGLMLAMAPVSTQPVGQPAGHYRDVGQTIIDKGIRLRPLLKKSP